MLTAGDTFILWVSIFPFLHKSLQLTESEQPVWPINNKSTLHIIQEDGLPTRACNATG